MEIEILLIEGKRADSPSFNSGLLKKGYRVESVPTGKSAEQYLNNHKPHVVVVNAASMRTTGLRICQTIRKLAKSVPVVLIVEEAPGNPDKVEANDILILPFTLQKLHNRIRPLLPSDEKDLIRVGTISLDTEQRSIRLKGGRQATLTPRLVALLKVLMERPGEVVEREELFRQVWDTAYTEDMRTLDVHVSWLRQAVEEDPRRPKLIKTVRGKGYRLDI